MNDADQRPAVVGQVERPVRPLTPLQARIVAALTKMPGRRADWYDLGRMLWPHDKHPRAWNYSSNGGPPGWAMSLSRAVGQMQRAGLVHDDRKAAGVRSIRLLRPNDSLTGRPRAPKGQTDGHED